MKKTKVSSSTHEDQKLQQEKLRDILLIQTYTTTPKLCKCLVTELQQLDKKYPPIKKNPAANHVLLFYLKTQAFKARENPAEARIFANDIYNQFMSEGSLKIKLFDDVLVSNVKSAINAATLDMTLFQKAEEIICSLFILDYLPSFLKSAEYINYCLGSYSYLDFIS